GSEGSFKNLIRASSTSIGLMGSARSGSLPHGAMMRFTTLSLVVSLLFPLLPVGCAAEIPTRSPDAPSMETEQTASGRVGSHGMIVTGTPGEAWISHVPMFRAPHDVQLVVAGSFAPEEGAAVLPASLDSKLFTFLPDPASLDALRTGMLHELRGTLFFGN